ncbi:MAG: 30S ribosomal protein S2, partial [Hyphomicrobiales bacterium]|nr:30S ribosomal protein S2 [Hyphomicrobiales bacterium]
ERDKLERALGGIKDMGGIPDLLFVIDTNKEAIAVQEARRLGIPVVAIVDSNCDPEPITYPVPGNDDAGRAINFYCDLVAKAVIDGISRGQGDVGIDLGAAEEPPMEAIAEDVAVAEAEIAAPAAEEEAPAEAAAEAPAATEEVAAEEAPAEDAAAEPEAEAPSAEEAPAAAFKGLDAPKGEADALTKITGVGPAIEKKLHGLGIYHFWQIAEFSAEDIAAVDAELNFKGRIERDDWIGQAKAFIAESA